MVNIALKSYCKGIPFLYSQSFLLYTSPPIYHQQKNTSFKHLNTAEYQRSSFLKKLRKLAVGAKKS